MITLANIPGVFEVLSFAVLFVVCVCVCAHSEYLLQIADEFKIVVIDAIQSLCVKYPQKHSVLLNFLSVSLREVRHRYARGGALFFLLRE